MIHECLDENEPEILNDPLRYIPTEVIEEQLLYMLEENDQSGLEGNCTLLIIMTSICVILDDRMDKTLSLRPNHTTPVLGP